MLTHGQIDALSRNVLRELVPCPMIHRQALCELQRRDSNTLEMSSDARGLGPQLMARDGGQMFKRNK